MEVCCSIVSKDHTNTKGLRIDRILQKLLTAGYALPFVAPGDAEKRVEEAEHG